MVESYLSNEVSYEELALANGITNYTMISRWVEAFEATYKEIEEILLPKVVEALK
jgi:transposase-like protein